MPLTLTGHWYRVEGFSASMAAAWGLITPDRLGYNELYIKKNLNAGRRVKKGRKEAKAAACGAQWSGDVQINDETRGNHVIILMLKKRISNFLNV